ncbi:hypothetical protein XPA_000849 [Xanthoria parietina]
MSGWYVPSMAKRLRRPSRISESVGEGKHCAASTQRTTPYRSFFAEVRGSRGLVISYPFARRDPTRPTKIQAHDSPQQAATVRTDSNVVESIWCVRGNQEVQPAIPQIRQLACAMEGWELTADRAVVRALG